MKYKRYTKELIINSCLYNFCLFAIHDEKLAKQHLRWDWGISLCASKSAKVHLNRTLGPQSVTLMSAHGDSK